MLRNQLISSSWISPGTSHPTPQALALLPAALHSYAGDFHGFYTLHCWFGRKFLERHIQVFFKDSLIHINESIFMLYISYCSDHYKITQNLSGDVQLLYNDEICNDFYNFVLDKRYLPSLTPPSVMPSSLKLWFYWEIRLPLQF